MLKTVFASLAIGMLFAAPVVKGGDSTDRHEIRLLQEFPVAPPTIADWRASILNQSNEFRRLYSLSGLGAADGTLPKPINKLHGLSNHKMTPADYGLLVFALIAVDRCNFDSLIYSRLVDRFINRGPENADVEETDAERGRSDTIHALVKSEIKDPEQDQELVTKICASLKE